MGIKMKDFTKKHTNSNGCQALALLRSKIIYAATGIVARHRTEQHRRACLHLKANNFYTVAIANQIASSN